MYACEKRENAQFSRVAKTFKRSEEEKRREEREGMTVTSFTNCTSNFINQNVPE